MGQNQRRPGFLRWGEGARGADADASGESPAPETQEEQPTAEAAMSGETTPSTEATAAAPESEPPATTPAADASEASPFLRDLVGAMRGVAESSRESTVSEFRQSVDARIEELQGAAEERASDLRRRSELDLGGIGDWERTELERVRGEAEQRRKARRELLEKELAEHQAASEAELEAVRAKLTDYEREMDAFFAKLGDIADPAAFVAAAKRMPPPPDLATSSAGAAKPGEAVSATAETGNGNGAAPAEDRLAQRLAQLDERLGAATATSTEPATEEPAGHEPGLAAPAASDAAASDAAASPAATATAAPPVTATTPAQAAAPGTSAEASTAIVVKGLGSFGAITSFKQALERVDGIRGVTLSLGPTGDFVYRASHAGEFDLVEAIRSIEGPNAIIENVDGQLRVTIERPR